MTSNHFWENLSCCSGISWKVLHWRGVAVFLMFLCFCCKWCVFLCCEIFDFVWVLCSPNCDTKVFHCCTNEEDDDDVLQFNLNNPKWCETSHSGFQFSSSQWEVWMTDRSQWNVSGPLNKTARRRLTQHKIKTSDSLLPNTFDYCPMPNKIIKLKFHTAHDCNQFQPMTCGENTSKIQWNIRTIWAVYKSEIVCYTLFG